MAIRPRKTPFSAWGGQAPNTIAMGAKRKPAVKAATTSTPRAPVQPTQPQAPPAPQTQAPPPVATTAPPPTLQSGLDRTTTRNQYGGLVTDVNSQLRSLAMQYGGAPKALQYGYDPTTGADTQSELDVTPNSPGSTLEVLARNLAAQKKNVDENNEANNTFFGSYRLGQLGDADKSYQGDLATAKRQYDDAVAALMNSITQGRGTRNSNLSQADIQDLLAAQANAPEAQQVAPAVAPPQAGYLDYTGHFVSQGITSAPTAALINQWIDQQNAAKKKPKR